MTRTVPPPRRPGSARFLFGATMLSLELFVVLFAALVAYGLRLAPVGWVLGGAGALAVLIVVALVTLRRGPGWVIGTVVQVLLVACALVVPAMLIAGLVFAGLWLAAHLVGTRVDAERRERHAHEMSLWEAGAPPYDEAHDTHE